MNLTIDQARELVADAVLWPRVRDFLWDFVPQIHPSWIEDLNVPSHLLTSSPPHPLKRFILDSLGVAPCFHAFPKEDWSRLLLLDGATLESMVKWLGAIALSEDLRRVMDGKTVRGLKESLRGVYPEVFAYTAYFKGIDFRGKGAKPQEDCIAGGETVVRKGASIVACVLSGVPEPLVSRLWLKLPKDLGAVEPLHMKPEASRKALAKLLKLKFPEAYSLCC